MNPSAEFNATTGFIITRYNIFRIVICRTFQNSFIAIGM